MIVISRGMIVTSRGMTFPPGIERGCIGRMKGDERRRSKRLCVAIAQSIQRRHVGIGALLNLLRLCLSKAEEGIDEDSGEYAPAVVDAAGLGYCELFEFKCAADRTCDAWLTGGPITKEMSGKQTAILEFAKKGLDEE